MADNESMNRLHSFTSSNLLQGAPFHLRLPDGWLGRPFDNLYFVKSVEWVGGSLKIGTTDDEMLFIADVADIRDAADGIEIAADGPVSFEWTTYGGTDRQRRLSPSGVVTLFKPLGN